MQGEWKRGGIFLWLDSIPDERRRDARARLLKDEVVIDRMESEAPTRTPGALIHNWIGTVFIPGASLRQVLTVIQSYDRHHEYYAPEVTKSKLLTRTGDDFRVYLRLRQVKVLTVVLDTEHEVHYTHLDATHVFSRSISTRIAEVKRPGEHGERALPPGKDNGFLWRLNSYWRFLETGGGVYVQCEAISLTRDIPTGLGFLLRPFIESVPRESLTFTLQSTRLAVLHSLSPRSARQEIAPAAAAHSELILIASKPLSTIKEAKHAY